MSQLIYSPFGALNQLHRELNSMFDDDQPLSHDTSGWVPQVDILEEEGGYRLVADLPGVSPTDVEVTVDKNVLTMRGSRSTRSESANGGYRRRERMSGTFVRQFTLPNNVDEDSIKAKVANGVLEVSIPRAAQESPRTITVE